MFQQDAEQPVEKFANACMEAAGKSYRCLVDLILKFVVQGVSMHKLEEAIEFVKEYKPEHMSLLSLM